MYSCGNGRKQNTARVSLRIIMLVSIFAVSWTASLSQNEDLLETGRATRLVEAAKAPAEITVVTYNIRWRTDSQLQQISDWLKRKSPSLIALQEVDRAKQRTHKTNNARVLADALGMYYTWAAPPLPKSSKDHEEETGVELLSPYPLRDITRIVLPHEGPGGRWRAALGATVTIGKSDVRVYSVHSETRIPVQQKIDQLRAVLSDLGHFPTTTPAVVMGDFNSWEPSAVEHVRQLFTKEGFATPFSDNLHTFRRNAVLFHINLKLDWIWLRGLTAQSFGIDRTIIVSDHFPLWTTLRQK